MVDRISQHNGVRKQHKTRRIVYGLSIRMHLGGIIHENNKQGDITHSIHHL